VPHKPPDESWSAILALQTAPAEIADLLDFVIRSTYFQYKPWGEQAIESTPYKPNIWKRYVNDTFTILDRSNVESFLHHFNSQQSTIRFTMETEKDLMIAFF